MFISKFFIQSLKPKEVFDHLSDKLYKYFIYFVLLMLIMVLPQNINIIQNYGFKLHFIENTFHLSTPTWVLPEDVYFSTNKLVSERDISFTYKHEGLTYIFNYKGQSLNDNEKYILLKEAEVTYIDEKGNQITRPYKNFTETFSLKGLNLATGQDKTNLYIEFANNLESSFGPYITLYSLLTNVFVTLFIQCLFVFLLALVVQLFRYGLTSFMSYKDTIKFVILMLTIPVFLSLIVGIIQPAFGTVVFQFGAGITIMLVMLKYGRKYYQS